MVQRLLSAQSPDWMRFARRVAEIQKRHKGRCDPYADSRTREEGLPEKTKLDINDVVQEILPLTSGSLPKHGVSVRQNSFPAFRSAGDRVQLQQVILNL